MQSDMYPLCPYHDAWKPGTPLGTRAGGAMPGPTLRAHVAAREAYVGMSAAISAKTNRRLRTLPTTRLTRGRGQRYVKVAERCLRIVTSSDARRALPRTIACRVESVALPCPAGEAVWAGSGGGT